MKKTWLFITCTILLLSITGCRQSAAGKGSEKPLIRGVIMNVTHNSENKTAALLVEGQIEEDTQYDKARVRVDSNTKIYKAESKDMLSISDLKEGIKVEIYWDGPVAESYPVQMGSNIIRILQ